MNLKKAIYSIRELKSKDAAVSIVIISNAVVWYYVALILFLQNSVENISISNQTTILIWALHFGGLIISALFGGLLAKRVKRKKLLDFWMILGIISSAGIIFLDVSNLIILAGIGILIGISLGIGMPAVMGYFTDFISVEKRGRISGIIVLISGIATAGFGLLAIDEIWILGLTLLLWRFIGLLIFSAYGSKEVFEKEKAKSKYTQILNQHSFILYFIPWVMFSLINYLVAPTIPSSEIDPSGNIAIIQLGFSGISALIGGFFIDSVGRKRIAILGFTLLGIGTAVLGISNSMMVIYFNAIIDGVAWGLLIVLFIFTLWGDLSFNSVSEKYFAIGAIPFFISKFLELTVGDYLTTTINNPSALFSFGAFFLFMAVLPLVYAPETLPEKITQRKNLENYLEKAKEAADKYY